MTSNTSQFQSHSTLEVRVVTGLELTPHLEALAHLRIPVFRDYPYLYDGDMEYEQPQLKTTFSWKDVGDDAETDKRPTSCRSDC